MQSFYKHILIHCNEYDVQTLELVRSSKNRGGLSPTLWDISQNPSNGLVQTVQIVIIVYGHGMSLIPYNCNTICIYLHSIS